MASEADSSHFEHSATQDSSQTRTRGPSAHTIWIHSCTARETNGEDPKLKYCIHCITTPIYGTLVTTNMQRQAGRRSLFLESTLDRRLDRKVSIQGRSRVDSRVDA